MSTTGVLGELHYDIVIISWTSGLYHVSSPIFFCIPVLCQFSQHFHNLKKKSSIFYWWDGYGWFVSGTILNSFFFIWGFAVCVIIDCLLLWRLPPPPVPLFPLPTSYWLCLSSFPLLDSKKIKWQPSCCDCDCCIELVALAYLPSTTNACCFSSSPTSLWLQTTSCQICHFSSFPPSSLSPPYPASGFPSGRLACLHLSPHNWESAGVCVHLMIQQGLLYCNLSPSPPQHPHICGETSEDKAGILQGMRSKPEEWGRSCEGKVALLCFSLRKRIIVSML